MSEGVETFVKDLAKQNGQSVDEAAANFVKQHRPSSLIQRFASVDEIANMVVYVASKEASATNGAALRAEGGIVNTIAGDAFVGWVSRRLREAQSAGVTHHCVSPKGQKRWVTLR